MSFPSLIAHNGVSHQKSNSVEHPKASTIETETVTEQNVNSKTIAPEGNSSSTKQILETTQNEVENSTTTEIQTTKDLTSATLVPGFGESIFTLLVVSPFLLFGFKQWLHR